MRLPGGRADVVEPIAPRNEARLVGEEDEHGVVAGQRADLLAERRFVDRLGDDAGRPRRAGDDEGQAAPADRDRDVGEDPAEPLVGARRAGRRLRRRSGARIRDERLGRDVGVALRARDLDQPEIGDIATDGRLRDREPQVVQPVDEVALAADRLALHDLVDGALAISLGTDDRRRGRDVGHGDVAVVAEFGRRGRQARLVMATLHQAAPTADRPAVIRVPNVASPSARASAPSGDESAMIASVPSQASAASAARTFGTMPPAITPLSMSVSASSLVSVSSRRPSPSRTPSTSVSSTSWRAPIPAAIPAAASSALTLHTTPSSSRASGATTGTWPPTRIASRRSRRSPTTWATSPIPGTRSLTSSPPSTPERPTASTPRSRSAATSSLLTTPRRTAAATSRAAWSVTRRPFSNLEGTPIRSSHSVIRLPPPWTRTTGRRRATAATSSRTCACSAIVVPPSFTTSTSLMSCTPNSRSRIPG